MSRCHQITTLEAIVVSNSKFSATRILFLCLCRLFSSLNYKLLNNNFCICCLYLKVDLHFYPFILNSQFTFTQTPRLIELATLDKFILIEFYSLRVYHIPKPYSKALPSIKSHFLGLAHLCWLSTSILTISDNPLVFLQSI